MSNHVTRVVLCERDKLLSTDASRPLLIADSITAKLVAGLTSCEEEMLRLPAGEAGKQWESVATVLSAALDAGLARDGLFIAIGGGVVCDVAAFAASIYQRGIEVILVPTTLLAMVDAAVGGKTGINFAGYKNMVGSFHPAKEVRLHMAFLQSLPKREFQSGIAEVIKSAMLGDPGLLNILENQREAVLRRDDTLMLELVTRSLKLKKRFVEEDYTEGGNRAFLNLGHTFGHGLESVAGLGEWTHGEAVVWGMARALDAGERIGRTDPDYRRRCLRLFEDYGYRLHASNLDPSRLIEAMGRDKKKKAGVVRFVLQNHLGQTFLSTLPVKTLDAVVAAGVE